ncbi:MAG: hypothetical protein J6D10_09185 [Clostridia bacterium]|nr:hypothetical protein [Clostridia bacterium]
MADGSVTIGVVLDTAAFAASVAGIQGQLSGMAVSINQSLTNAFSGAAVDASLVAAIANLAAGVTAASGSVEAAMTALALSASAAFANGGWSEAGSLAAQGIAGGVSSGGGAVIAAVQAVANQALAAFSSGTWSSIGHDMMSGIAAGVRAAGAEVTAAINSVAREAEEAVKQYYDIKSPSGLMRDEVGVMISRGIAEGILSGAGFVNRAMETVGSGAERIRRAESGTFGYGSRSVTQNIYLRDNDASPYKTARRIRRESEAMFRN